MPELPEVETIVGQLNKVLPGRVIREVEVLRDRSFTARREILTGKKIKKLSRRSKMIEVEFVDSEMMMVIHLKMTGQLIFMNGEKRIAGGHPTADWVKDLPSKHTRVIIYFTDGTKLFFNDLRVFGWIKLMDKEAWKKLIEKLPPDVTDENFSPEYFRKCLTGKRPIKLLLTDQEKIGGVGNIYANEALFEAKINPKKTAGEITADEALKLHRAIKKVIALGIKYGGASIDKYVDLFGKGGKFQEYFQVYQRGGEECLRKDGGIIRKLKMGGRSAFFCPVCQK